MQQKIKLLFILFISFSAMGQNAYTYEIKTALFTLGELKVTQTPNCKSNSVHYKLSTSLHLWSIYKIDYFMESHYVNDTLISAVTSIKVNDKKEHFCSTKKAPLGYEIQDTDGKKKLINQKIITSITPLYFNNYTGSDSIFTEYSGEYLPFNKKNNSSYILNPNDPMEFIFKDGHINKVIIHNSIMDFYIELKKEYAMENPQLGVN